MLVIIIIGLLLDLVLIITTGLTEYPGSKPSPQLALKSARLWGNVELNLIRVLWDSGF